MPLGLLGMKYLVLAKEEFPNFIKGQALRTKSTEGVCRFILEDIFSRYGNIDKMRADCRELNLIEAKEFFDSYETKLRLTIAYNLEANVKSEKRHPPIMNALVKVCKGKPKQQTHLLSFALWVDRTIHIIVTSYVSIEFILN